PVLRRDVLRDELRPDVIPLICQTPRAHDVDRERMVHPPGERADVAHRDVVTTGQHRHARSRTRRELEHAIGQPTAGMDGYYDVSGQYLDVVHRTGNEREPSGEPRPTFHERIVQR